MSDFSSLVLLFFAIFAANLFLFIKLSGWDVLASKYGYSRPFSGNVAWLSTAYIGTVRFRGCIGIGVSAAGLYLNPFVIFRLHYPPILVPWSEVSRFEAKDGFLGVG